MAGGFVVFAILVSACVAGYEAVARLVDPRTPDNLAVLAAAGVLGYAGNWLAASIRTNAGRRLRSAALIADGDHARADAYVSLAVVASAAVVALGFDLADPLIGLGITLVILRTPGSRGGRSAAARPTHNADRPRTATRCLFFGKSG